MFDLGRLTKWRVEVDGFSTSSWPPLGSVGQSCCAAKAWWLSGEISGIEGRGAIQ
jgi:hypothetical protein